MNTGDRANTGNGIHRFYWLDWLRFTAALMVVACHARGGNWVEWGRLESMYQTKTAYLFFVMTRAGFEWVIVFFALSGFLVGGKVLERMSDSTFNAPAYAVDRISRIWMPLIPALLLTAGISFFLGHSISALSFIGNLLGLQGILCWSFGDNYPLWSLAYEIWFYVLAGCTAVAVNKNSRNRLWAYFGVTISVMVFTKLDATFLFCWILGALSYSQIGWINRKAIVVGCMLAIAGYIFSQLAAETLSFNQSSFRKFLPSHGIAILILSAGLALVIPALSKLQPRFILGEAFERLGSRLAAFSYTLYLTHYPLLELWGYFIPKRNETISLTSMLWFAAEVTSCLLVAWILYLPFEGKTSVVRSWFRDRFNIKTEDRSCQLARIQS